MLDVAPINRTRPPSDEQATGRRSDPEHGSSPVSPAQIRAARAMLDWSMIVLAVKARVSVSTIKRFEDGHGAPASVSMMRGALETEGICFLDDDGYGAGVRLRRPV